MKGAKEAMEQLTELGYELIVHSVVSESVVEDWLDYFKIPYHSVTRIKPNADLYIDDKGYRFLTWNRAIGDILNIYGRPTS